MIAYSSLFRQLSIVRLKHAIERERGREKSSEQERWRERRPTHARGRPTCTKIPRPWREVTFSRDHRSRSFFRASKTRIQRFSNAQRTKPAFHALNKRKLYLRTLTYENPFFVHPRCDSVLFLIFHQFQYYFWNFRIKNLIWKDLK